MFLKVDQQLERADRVIRQRIRPHISPVLASCKVSAFENPGEPEAANQFLSKVRKGSIEFTPFKIGNPWGTTWGTTWFKIEGRVPDHTSGRAVQLVMDMGWYDHSVGGHIEGLAYREDGTAIKSLHPRNYWVPLITTDGDSDPVVTENGGFTIYVEAACNPLLLGVIPFIKTELGDHATGKPEEQYILRSVDVCEYDEEIEGLWMDLDVVSSLIKELDEKSPRYWKLAKALQTSLNLYDERDLTTVAPAREALKGVLSSPANASSLRHTAIGHAHIDSAWLWPVRETRRKVARTVSNVLALMDIYPDFKYAMSSAQQYAWLEEDHPDLFAKVVERVKEGRFIPVGGQWVEADGMLPTGESLIRQISYGKRYFMEKFGIEPKGIWLPDSFGYTGAYPQIAKRAGYEWFLTQKISWNDTTKFPHHSFMWEGVDGSRIFTHFPPSDTYAAEVTAKELHYSEENFQDKDVSSRAMMLFGYGDGGGGPVREMVERVHRFENLEGAPRVEIGKPDDFFREARAEMEETTGGDMPSWKGELYLELHRGTLTSQQDMKRGCRQEEALLRATEYLCTAAALKSAAYDYPKKELDGIWKTLMLNQFHDILPGSAISWVHREARAEYKRDIKRLRAIAAEACAEIETATQAPLIEHARISQYRAQASESWTAKSVSDTGSHKPVNLTREDGRVVVDNGVIRAVIEADGTVSELYDSANKRNVIPEGCRLGGYELLKNEPSVWDAWEIERDALLRAHTVTGSQVVSGEVDDNDTAVIKVAVKNSAADIDTTISLKPGAKELDFAARVNWKAEEEFLKVDLPLALAPQNAQFECQYGTVERPIVKNTPSDEAKYESCTHRFVRLNEAGYSIGVANASTYGCDTQQIPSDRTRNREAGTLLRLSLLTAPQFPDPRTDLGEHDFAWTVLADADEASMIQSASELNAPVLDSLPAFEPLVSLTDVTGVPVVDWIKPADDGSGDVIARVYEAAGGHAVATLGLNADLAQASVIETDVLERNQLSSDEPLALKGATEEPRNPIPAQGALVELGPYQLATLRLHTASFKG
ncbi:MAG: glycosyl hydrolase-related protein [Bifidobacteriaceae bacterium]|nr:glycosyl hydrolase-related protein [Bifidobacteriaceae bacterium]MCI1914834.1 glycosyl hydrolase-related protein [Bifidobacteriaceae bacterium]